MMEKLSVNYTTVLSLVLFSLLERSFQVFSSCACSTGCVCSQRSEGSCCDCCCHHCSMRLRIALGMLNETAHRTRVTLNEGCPVRMHLDGYCNVATREAQLINIIVKHPAGRNPMLIHCKGAKCFHNGSRCRRKLDLFNER